MIVVDGIDFVCPLNARHRVGSPYRCTKSALRGIVFSALGQGQYLTWVNVRVLCRTYADFNGMIV
jgi:hypothetical protein